MQDALGRRLRYTRSRPHNRQLKIGQSDLDILALLSRFRYLRRHFISDILGRPPQRLTRRLRELYDSGFVDRPISQWEAFNARYSSVVYEVTRKGLSLLDEIPPQITSVKGNQYKHDIIVCDTMASLYLGAKKAGDTFVTYPEIFARAKAATFKIPCVVEGKQTHIIPDGLFGVKYKDGTYSFFALEVERGNSITSKNPYRAFQKKVVGYRDIIRRRTYEQLGIPNLRVLVVTRSEARIRSMCELISSFAEKSNLFLFHSVPTQDFCLEEPKPFPELYTDLWSRAGLESINIVK